MRNGTSATGMEGGGWGIDRGRDIEPADPHNDSLRYRHIPEKRVDWETLRELDFGSRRGCLVLARELDCSLAYRDEVVVRGKPL